MPADYTIGFEKDSTPSYAHVQQENMDMEVAPEEVSLSSFKLRDTLENKIWDEDGELDRRVRRTLMDVADDFWETCNISWVRPSALILTGSICNYNWSEYSDIDLHIVVDFSKIHKRKDFVQEYFDDKKNDWNNTHKDLTAYGYPIELYVQDIDSDVESGGIYDVWQSKWIKEPEKGKMKPIKLNKYAIKQVAADIMTEIDDLTNEFDNTDDKHKIEIIGKKCDKLLKKIKAIRQIGLKSGEMGSGNVVYKVARRAGYLDKIWELQTKVYDKLNSVDKKDSFSEKISRIF